jgi:hypothetical protein
MDYNQLNKLFEDLHVFRHTNRTKLVERITLKEIDKDYGSQGDTSVYHEVYPFDGEMFIRLTINTDSYGYNEFINGIQFVKPIQKTVTMFETL